MGAGVGGRIGGREGLGEGAFVLVGLKLGRREGLGVAVGFLVGGFGLGVGLDEYMNPFPFPDIGIEGPEYGRSVG